MLEIEEQRTLRNFDGEARLRGERERLLKKLNVEGHLQLRKSNEEGRPKGEFRQDVIEHRNDF